MLNRVEEQAAEIADLKQQLKTLREHADAVPAQTEEAGRRMLEGMARTTVNCGSGSSCWLAKEMLKTRAG